MAEERFDEIDAIKVVFSNPTGKKLIQHWHDTFILGQSYYPPGMNNDESTPIEMAYREGQRAFATLIYNAINEVKHDRSSDT